MSWATCSAGSLARRQVDAAEQAVGVVVALVAEAAEWRATMRPLGVPFGVPRGPAGGRRVRRAGRPRTRRGAGRRLLPGTAWPSGSAPPAAPTGRPDTTPSRAGARSGIRRLAGVPRAAGREKAAEPLVAVVVAGEATTQAGPRRRGSRRRDGIVRRSFGASRAKSGPAVQCTSVRARHVTPAACASARSSGRRTP